MSLEFCLFLKNIAFDNNTSFFWGWFHRYGIAFISVVIAAMYVFFLIHFFYWKICNRFFFFHSLNGGRYITTRKIFSIVSWTSIPFASFFGSNIILLFTSEWHLAFEAYGTRTNFFGGGFHVWLKPMLKVAVIILLDVVHQAFISHASAYIYNRNICHWSEHWLRNMVVVLVFFSLYV